MGADRGGGRSDCRGFGGLRGAAGGMFLPSSGVNFVRLAAESVVVVVVVDDDGGVAGTGISSPTGPKRTI